MSYAPQGVGQVCGIQLSGTGITQIGPNEYALTLSVSGNNGSQSCVVTVTAVDIDGDTVSDLQGQARFETFGNLIDSASASWYQPATQSANPAFSDQGVVTLSAHDPSAFEATVTANGVGQVSLNASYPLGGTLGIVGDQGSNGDVGVYAKLSIQVVA